VRHCDVGEILPAGTRSVAPQPPGVAWPTPDWPIGEPDAAIDELVAQAFADPALAETYAVVVVRDGGIVAERYGGALPSFSHPPTPVTASTPLLSWSMAKSCLHAAVGVLVDEDRLDPDAAAPVPEWRGDGDPRTAITLRQLLQMRDGLDWCEDYVDDRISDVIEMLFATGQRDVAGFAAKRPLEVPPGTRFNYSSGTSNLIARIVGDVVGHGAATEAFLRDRLWEPLSMHDATVTIDDAGTFIGSSYVYCTARSMAKFATMYLRGGIFADERLVSERWTLDAQLPTSIDVEPRTYYSHHWWLDGTGVYWASGYEGQRAVVVPDCNAVVVRYGRTPEAAGSVPLRAWVDQMVVALGHRA
jgi:CubicO group peptidase (beta-lactamase class C family)